MRAAGNFSKAACSQYERRWMEAYGHDFAWVRPRVRGQSVAGSLACGLCGQVCRIQGVGCW